jgi:hypothetical protein
MPEFSSTQLLLGRFLWWVFPENHQRALVKLVVRARENGKASTRTNGSSQIRAMNEQPVRRA